MEKGGWIEASGVGDSGSGGSRLGGGCAFRRDGFLPPQE